MGLNEKANIVETVLCYIMKRHTVLMLYRNKKEKDINKNKWIGVGGHIEEGESPIDAVLREVEEETTLKMTKFEKRANIMFHYDGIFEYMHVFVCTEYKGRVRTDCPEGTLKWIPRTQVLTSLPVWEGDPIFLKKIFNNEPFFEMAMWYEKDKLVKYEIIDNKED